MTRMPSIGAALLAASLVVPVMARAEDKPAGVTIGYLNLVNAQLVSKALGLHEKAMGVPIKWVKFGSGGDVNRVVAAGEIDFGGVGNPPASIGVTRDLPYQAVTVLNMLGPVESMVVRKDKQIASLKDLVGKSAAAPFGSTTHYLFIAALRDAGVKPTDVKLLDMAPSDAVAAWLRKDIDAAYVWEPSLHKMVQNGGEILVDSGKMAARGYPTWDVSVVLNGFATKYPSLVAKFARSECAAIDFWLKEPGKTSEIIAKELDLPIDDAQRMMAGTTMVPCAQQVTAEYFGSSAHRGKFVDTLIATATFLKEQDRLPAVKERAAYERFINPSYLEAALKP